MHFSKAALLALAPLASVAQNFNAFGENNCESFQVTVNPNASGSGDFAQGYYSFSALGTNEACIITVYTGYGQQPASGSYTIRDGNTEKGTCFGANGPFHSWKVVC